MIRISVQIWLYCTGKMKIFIVFLHVIKSVSVNWTGSLLLSYNTHGQVWVYTYIVVSEEGGDDRKCVTGHDKFLARSFMEMWLAYTPPTRCLSFVKCEGLQGGPAQQHQQSQSCLNSGVCMRIQRGIISAGRNNKELH